MSMGYHRETGSIPSKARDADQGRRTEPLGRDGEDLSTSLVDDGQGHRSTARKERVGIVLHLAAERPHRFGAGAAEVRQVGVYDLLLARTVSAVEGIERHVHLGTRPGHSLVRLRTKENHLEQSRRAMSLGPSRSSGLG